MISVVSSVQKYTSLYPLYRVNATDLVVFRLRNNKDLESFIDEVSTVADKKTLLALYHIATSEPYSFLYCKLNATHKNDIFYQNLDKRLIVQYDKLF